MQAAGRLEDHLGGISRLTHCAWRMCPSRQEAARTHFSWEHLGLPPLLLWCTCCCPGLSAPPLTPVIVPGCLVPMGVFF